MKLTARQDIQADIGEVWSVLTDFDSLEAIARGRGLGIKRDAGQALPVWTVGFNFRDKPREAEAQLLTLEEPTRITGLALGKSLEAEVIVDLQPLGPNRTRMTIETEVKARSLSARLFLQSLKLARGRIEGRYTKVASQLAAYVEKRAKPLA